MIQDIAPHRLDRTYVIGRPDAADIALCVRRGKVLLQKDGDGWTLPRFGSAIPTEDALHVFSLDGVDCYLARTPDTVPEGMAYVEVSGIRSLRPMEVAFAAITAVQLHRWYGARQFSAIRPSPATWSGPWSARTAARSNTPRYVPPSLWPLPTGTSCC